MSEGLWAFLRAIFSTIAFVGCAISLVGLFWIGVRHYYLEKSVKNSVLGFFGGPIVFFIGDKDHNKYKKFMRWGKIFGPIFLISGLVLAALTGFRP